MKLLIKILFTTAFSSSIYSQNNFNVLNTFCEDSIRYQNYEFNLIRQIGTLNKEERRSINYSNNYIISSSISCEGIFLVKIINQDSVIVERGFLKGDIPQKVTENVYSMANSYNGSTNDSVQPVNMKTIWVSILFRYGKWEYYNDKGSFLKTKYFKEEKITEKYIKNELKAIKKRRKEYFSKKS